ncbi:hypothetical protein [Methylobrevis pamukkalensis]|uniref:Uncharacterized protein n=1 Tax=Methylobrevis pamukkalensis TaxID=1439726 RepID=A0A1E3GZT1_9HYPH|nr:hypothetical protein [Methylobrevis pamukkalensis]ODN69560.1 hypothetical protein A6302_03154 [Methylobrevis pamukkalensis]
MATYDYLDLTAAAAEDDAHVLPLQQTAGQQPRGWTLAALMTWIRAKFAATPLAVAGGGTGAASARAAAAALGFWHTLGKSAGPLPSSPHTGTTAETVLATVAIPAGAMGPNGALRITSLWQYTNSGTDKTLRIRLGGLAGDVVADAVVSTTRTWTDLRVWRNQNSQSAQVGYRTAATNAIAATTTVDFATGSKDTSAAQDLVFTAELASGSANAQLIAYHVEVLYGA